MKRLIPRKWVINRRHAVRERGSVTLETALVMPMFLLFVFFLLFLVQTSATMMALHGALSQTVRMTAAAWYPISLIQTEGSEEREEGEAAGAKRSVGAFARWLPAPLNDWAEALSKGEWSPEAEAAKLPLRQLVVQLSDPRQLDADRLRITGVKLPDYRNEAGAYLTMEAAYRLPVRVPWTGKPLIVRVSVKERAWVGGSPSRATLPDETAAPLDIAFISLEPNPVRPGRKATLVLETRPGASLDLSVLYKSGQSQAKHLGTAVADESGRIAWTWHISGNTTSGEWTWAVRGEGGASYSQTFRVERTTDK